MFKKVLLTSVCFACLTVFAEKFDPKPRTLTGNNGANYDESKADKYKQLNVLDRPDGKGKVETAFEWYYDVRPQVLKFYRDEVYDSIAPRPAQMEFKLVESADDALDGIAIRKQYKVISRDKKGEHSFDLLVYIPKNAKKPVAAFLNANYTGNHSTWDDKNIILPKCWLRNRTENNTVINHATEFSRGKNTSRHPMKDIVSRGYAVATFCYCDVYPDKERKNPDGSNVNIDASEESLYKIFDKADISPTPRIIAAWAWGNMRALDCLETIKEIDASRVAVIGHSRLAKTALLTAAYDVRFAMVVCNEACSMGAALCRRDYGETVKLSAKRFPYWFSPNLAKYGDDVEAMKFDQPHFLATIAPRLLYVSSASDDLWADPKGEFMGLLEASKIYKLYGAKNLPTMDNLEIENPFIGDVGYHIRRGKHDITSYDWKCFMDFADSHGWSK